MTDTNEIKAALDSCDHIQRAHPDSEAKGTEMNHDKVFGCSAAFWFWMWLVQAFIGPVMVDFMRGFWAGVFG